MRGGNIRDPVVLDGKETWELKDIEAILRGGRLERPYVITDLHTEDN